MIAWRLDAKYEGPLVLESWHDGHWATVERSRPAPRGAEVETLCGCGGAGDEFHVDNVRCAVCPFCGARVKGTYYVEHECECWAREKEKKS